MTAILMGALAELDRSLQGLETVANVCAQRAKVAGQPQQDLFNGASGSRPVRAVPAEIVAGKLDLAIKRIEQILAEG